MTNGILSIRERSVECAPAGADDLDDFFASDPLENGPRVGTSRYFMRGNLHQAESDDAVAPIPSKARSRTQQEYDRLLRKFRYGEALDAALAKKNAVIVYCLLEELVSREAVDAAISGRDQESLEPLLEFLAKNVTNPAFSPLLPRIAKRTIDQYAPFLGQVPRIDKLVNDLRVKIKEEVEFQKRLHEVMGMMNLLVTAQASMSR